MLSSVNSINTRLKCHALYSSKYYIFDNFSTNDDNSNSNGNSQCNGSLTASSSSSTTTAEPTIYEPLTELCLSKYRSRASREKYKKTCLNVPTVNEDGFRRFLEPKLQIMCHLQYDDRAVVSLALLNQYSEILGRYANKLPILTISVCRFMYTIEAFTFYNQIRTETASQQALSFYIEQDIAYCEQAIDLPPNKRFSNLIHALRLNGYKQYIFNLARLIGLHVDFVVSQKLVARYIRVDDSLESNSIGIGFLTVIHDGNKWYVKTSKEPIVSDNVDMTKYRIVQPVRTNIRESLKAVNRSAILCDSEAKHKRNKYNDCVNRATQEIVQLDRYMQKIKDVRFDNCDILRHYPKIDDLN